MSAAAEPGSRYALLSFQQRAADAATPLICRAERRFRSMPERRFHASRRL